MEPLLKSTSLSMPEKFEDLENFFWDEISDNFIVDIWKDLDAYPLSRSYERVLGSFEPSEQNLVPCNSVNLEGCPKLHLLY